MPQTRLSYLEVISLPYLRLALLAALTCLSLLTINSQAHANCVNVGGIVTCLANDTDGFFSAIDITDLTVNNGITVDDTAVDSALGVINIGANVTGTIINNGTIIDAGPPDSGIFIFNNLNALTNNGIVQGNLAGVFVGNNLTTLINNGTIQGNFDGMFVGNDLTTLTNNGIIQGDFDGVFVINNLTTLTNNGTIIGGNNDEGIDVLNNITTLINNGTITGGVDGIFAGNDITSLTNNGTITGNSDEGIFAFNNIISLTNNGTITGNDNGVQANNDIIALINNGTIIAINDDAVDANDDIISLINNGTIIGGDDGVDADDNIVSLTNNGTIQAVENGVDAIMSLTTLVNNGTIIGGEHGVSIGTGGAGDGISNLTNAGILTAGNSFNAIFSNGGLNTTLTLLPGSDIFGGLDLGSGTNTLIVGKGHNIDHVFATLPNVINTNGMPFVISGTRVVVVDPSLFALSQRDEILFDLSQGIWGTVFNHIGDGRNPAGAFANNQAQFSLGSTPQNAITTNDTNIHMWASAFGSHRNQNADALNPATRHNLGGLIAGLDGKVTQNIRFGGFFGLSETEVEKLSALQEHEIESIFGGLYASLKADSIIIDLGVTAGTTEQDNTRIVDNNRVNGLQIVSSDFDGTFVAPELSLSTRVNFGTATLQPSLRIGYAGLFFDSITETGASAPLTFNNIDLEMIHARFELAALMSSKGEDSLNFNFSPYVGIDGRRLIAGETTNITVLGQNLNFNTGNEDEIASGFIGMRLSVLKTENFGLFAALEGSLDTDQNSVITGNAGLKWQF